MFHFQRKLLPVDSGRCFFNITALIISSPPASLCFPPIVSLHQMLKLPDRVSNVSFSTCHGFVFVVPCQFFGIFPELYLPTLLMKFLYSYSIFQTLVLISMRSFAGLGDIKKLGFVVVGFHLLHYQCFLWIPFFY